MIVWPVAIFLLVVFLAQELHFAKKSFKDFVSLFFKYGTIKKTPSRPHTALVVVTFVCIGFALWESVIRFMLQRDPSISFVLFASTLFLVAIALRTKKLKALSTWSINVHEWVMVFCAFALVLGSFFSAVLFCPWIYWRAKRALA